MFQYLIWISYHLEVKGYYTIKHFRNSKQGVQAFINSQAEEMILIQFNGVKEGEPI